MLARPLLPVLLSLVLSQAIHSCNFLYALSGSLGSKKMNVDVKLTGGHGRGRDLVAGTWIPESSGRRGEKIICSIKCSWHTIGIHRWYWSLTRYESWIDQNFRRTAHVEPNLIFQRDPSRQVGYGKRFEQRILQGWEGATSIGKILDIIYHECYG